MDDFEWDETKRLSNFRKHALDFRAAVQLFDGRSVVEMRSSYVHEERFRTTGKLDDRLITVIWTRRGTRIRIISVRRARDGEQREYRALYPD